MINTRKIALGLAGIITFSASASFAGIDVSTCQGALAKARDKFTAKIILRTTLCANKVAKENAKAAAAKPTDYSKVADYCNSQLQKNYTDEVAKLRTAVDSSIGVKCDTTTLTANGILLSGGGPAPGASQQKFIEDYLLATGEQMGISSVLKAIPNLGNLILTAQNAAAGVKPAPECKTTNATPFLCGLKVECAARACALDTTGAGQACTSNANCVGKGHCFGGACTGASDSTLVTNASTLAFGISGTESIDVCTINGDLAGAGLEANFLYLSGSPGRTLAPVVIPSTAVVCVDVLGGSGWVDCTGHGLPLNTDFCQDRIVQASETPNDQCGSPVSGASPDSSLMGFNGTKVGLPHNTPSGSSVAGSAFDVNLIQFSIEQPTDTGPDNAPCTADDTVAANAPVPVPLTTGTAQAEVQDARAFNGDGVCDDASTPCLEDINCVTNGGGCAGGVGSGCCTGVSLTTLSSGAVGPGAVKSCDSWVSNNLSGLKLVGAFPGGGGGAPLGDTVNAFTILCK